MKLAIPVNKDNKVDGHFGHCEMYAIVSLDDKNEIISTETIALPKGCGCKSDIAQTLAAQGVTIMLVDGIGTGAVNKLKGAGIEVVRGCSGEVKELALSFASGKITDNGSNCEHHHHQHEHHNGVCNHH